MVRILLPFAPEIPGKLGVGEEREAHSVFAALMAEPVTMVVTGVTVATAASAEETAEWGAVAAREERAARAARVVMGEERVATAVMAGRAVMETTSLKAVETEGLAETAGMVAARAETEGVGLHLLHLPFPCHQRFDDHGSHYQGG